jgi:tRNA (Thr-GGU) A37 N-methylase
MSFTPASPRYDTSTIRLLPWDDATSHSAGGALADGPYELQPIGWVESPLVDPATAPNKATKDHPRPGWTGLGDVLSVHPRDDPANPEQGVFSTRSPHRPNPIGLHRVNIVSIEGTRILVRNLEAVNGTPIVDVKPVLNRQLDG